MQNIFTLPLHYTTLQHLPLIDLPSGPAFDDKSSDRCIYDKSGTNKTQKSFA